MENTSGGSRWVLTVNTGRLNKRTSDRPGLTRATVEILLHDFINLRGEGDVVVRELAPGNEQESQGVVVKPVVTMDVGRHLESFKVTFNMEH